MLLLGAQFYSGRGSRRFHEITFSESWSGSGALASPRGRKNSCGDNNHAASTASLSRFMSR